MIDWCSGDHTIVCALPVTLICGLGHSWRVRRGQLHHKPRKTFQSRTPIKILNHFTCISSFHDEFQVLISSKVHSSEDRGMTRDRVWTKFVWPEWYLCRGGGIFILHWGWGRTDQLLNREVSDLEFSAPWPWCDYSGLCCHQSQKVLIACFEGITVSCVSLFMIEKKRNGLCVCHSRCDSLQDSQIAEYHAATKNVFIK